MIVEFDDPCRGFDPSHNAVSSNMNFKQFRQKVASLKPDELVSALSVECEQFNNLLAQLVVCVGCRRRYIVKDTNFIIDKIIIIRVCRSASKNCTWI